MDDRHDLEVILRSRTPIIVIETRNEERMLDMLKGVVLTTGSQEYLPLFRWTITDGLQRLDILLEPQAVNAQPTDVLKHIRAVSKPGIYVLLDFHPFLEDPVHVRLLKDICLGYQRAQRQLVLISHTVKLPEELAAYSARFVIGLPCADERRAIIKQVADEWAKDNPGSRVKADKKAYELLVHNLSGLTYSDTEQLARNAIFVDGAITKNDLPGVMDAKYALLNRGGALQFEYDTALFNDVGGMLRLKHWLSQRISVFRGDDDTAHLDVPKGILLLGVQGCGKSLAAKATAAIFGAPLLRLDFGQVYDKYHGETERKLREALQTAEVMSPCVLWIDEIEKGLAGRGGETGTTQRVLGTFLTWLAEKSSRVFVVATANAISELPPELVRKGRFDEIFFVDLPNQSTRTSILAIHLTNRAQPAETFDLEAIATAMRGFSGAEIEQAVVAALYAAHAQRLALSSDHLLAEVEQTRPLAVVMQEQIQELRSWAEGRTVPCD
jgi:SpoVK/Ycf46/Vps4 family AAA+-type ATPase